MKKFLVSGAFALLLVALAGLGCGKESSGADCSGVDATTNTYTNSIAAILNNSCALAGCHDAVTAEDGVNLSTYAASKAAFQQKDVLCSINHDGGCEPMPQGGSKLSDATIQKIECWVESGYKE